MLLLCKCTHFCGKATSELQHSWSALLQPVQITVQADLTVHPHNRHVHIMPVTKYAETTTIIAVAESSDVFTMYFSCRLLLTNHPSLCCAVLCCAVLRQLLCNASRVTFLDFLVQGGGFDGPPTRVPGGGRGHPGMGGGGRGMGRGPVMPPPGVAVDKWQQQGPMAPMPGQYTPLLCVPALLCC